MTGWLLLVGWMLIAPQANASTSSEHRFTIPTGGEAVATITAGCGACDWGIAGREAAVVRISVDGTYSQHLLIIRGATPAPYRLMLGALEAG